MFKIATDMYLYNIQQFLKSHRGGILNTYVSTTYVGIYPITFSCKIIIIPLENKNNINKTIVTEYFLIVFFFWFN